MYRDVAPRVNADTSYRPPIILGRAQTLPRFGGVFKRRREAPLRETVAASSSSAMSGKRRRHLLKVACWRLARLLRCSATHCYELDDQTLLIKASGMTPVRGRASRGDARRLAKKIARLRAA